MIKLFVSDLDGCLAYPFQSPEWKSISRIRELNLKSYDDEQIPKLTILSGRPMPYTEAIAQWMGVDVPMIFESGGGMYAFKDNELKWNQHFDKKARQSVVEIKEWMENNILKRYSKTIPEFAKFTDAGLINPSYKKIKLIHKEVHNYIKRNYPDFEVHHTEISVNVISRNSNKGEGLKMLADELRLDLSEIAYIGDTSGDVPALELAGMSFAPINATDYVKDIADIIVAEATLGVLEAYEYVIDMNKG